MARVSKQTFIACPAAEVWAFTTDLRRVPEWVPFTRAMLTIDGEGVGCRYMERGPLGKSTWTIVEVVDGVREVHEGVLWPARITLTNEVLPEGEGALYRQTVDFAVFPRLRPLGWLLERTVAGWIVRSSIAKNGPNAKRILEAD